MAKILIIDDSENTREILRLVLEDEGNFEVITAHSGLQGIERAEKEQPDLILLDIQMPELNGFDTCRHFKEDPKLSDIPVLFISGYYTSPQDVTKGLIELGAYDYIKKPFSLEEILARIRVMLNIQNEKKMIKELSLTDELTGLRNRRYLSLELKERINLAIKYNKPLTCAMIDIDLFKGLNDSYGHLFGDLVIKEIAAVIRRSTRLDDLVVRYGGEEFIVCAFEPMSGAYIFADRLRERVEKKEILFKKNSIRITVSIGIAICLEHVSDTEDTLIGLADSALYYAKHTGRNLVKCIPNFGLPGKMRV